MEQAKGGAPTLNADTSFFDNNKYNGGVSQDDTIGFYFNK